MTAVRFDLGDTFQIVGDVDEGEALVSVSLTVQKRLPGSCQALSPT